MELDSCIKGRRSVRAYTDEAVSKEHIQAIIEAGTWAPTGMNRQPWKFVVIQNKEIIKNISDETKAYLKQTRPEFVSRFSTEQDIICYDAPLLILICCEKDKQWENLNLLDCVLASQNMFLKAYALGLGSCYMGFVSYLGGKPDVLKKIGVPDNYQLMVPLIIGHPKTVQGNVERNRPEILTF